MNFFLLMTTSDNTACMEWKHYWRNVVKRYMVIIEGWPTNIPFHNISKASNSLTDLETLLRKWHCGKIYWREVTETELQDLDHNWDNQIEGGELKGPTPCHRHSDHGKKSPHMNPANGMQKKHHKLHSMILDSDEEEEDNPQSRPSTPDTEG